MGRLQASRAPRLLSAVLISGATGAAHALTSDHQGPILTAFSPDESASHRRSFADHVRTRLDESMEANSFIGALELPLLGTGPASFDDLLNARRRPVPVKAAAGSNDTVGASDALAMLLVGGGIVVYQLCRKQRSLEQRPLASL